MRIKGLLAGIAGLSLIAGPVVINAAELTITATSIPKRFELDGAIEAINAGTISAQTSGVIRAVNGDVNDRVSSGDILIEIDNTQQKAAVSQAEAALAQAEAMNDDAQTLLRRNTRLQKQGTLSEGEYDRTVAQAKSAAANVEAARAALTQAREQLSYTQVKAPYAGIIKERFVEVGELVNPGQPLMSGYGIDAMRAVADLPQRVASQYTSPEQISIIVNGESLDAASVTVYPFADPVRHSVRLRADLPKEASAGIIPGQWVKVQLTTGERTGIAVPANAVIRRGELSAVYLRDQERSMMRQVRTGNTFERDGVQWIEVLAGLNEGDVIFDDALAQLAQTASQGTTEGE